MFTPGRHRSIRGRGQGFIPPAVSVQGKTPIAATAPGCSPQDHSRDRRQAAWRLGSLPVCLPPAANPNTPCAGTGAGVSCQGGPMSNVIPLSSVRARNSGRKHAD
ncbi:MAG TPA: hypothetical protein DF966_11785, partial [Sulfitobacter sp.]|nr:hypothetical protein [Sulfitobacter sp.]